MDKFLDLDSMALAGEIARASDAKVWHIFAALQRERRLSVFVSELNASLHSEAERATAQAALRRFGLEYAG